MCQMFFASKKIQVSKLETPVAVGRIIVVIEKTEIGLFICFMIIQTVGISPHNLLFFLLVSLCVSCLLRIGSRCETLKIGVISHYLSFMAAERSATIRQEANAKTMGTVHEEKLDRTTSGSSSVDEENVEVELESEPVCRTERDVKVDEALQKRILAEFGQSESSVCGTWKKIVYMDDERWFSVVEERHMANVEVLRTQDIEKTGEKTVGVPGLDPRTKPLTRLLLCVDRYP